VDLASGVPRMLSISVPIGRPRKQAIVTLNCSNEIPMRCGLSSKFFDHLLNVLLHMFINAESTALKYTLVTEK